MSDCTFSGNTAEHRNGAGGIAVSSDVFGIPLISNTTFCENLPIHIGGPYKDGGGNEFSDMCHPPCPADIDGSGDVGIGDFLLVLGQWGPCPPKCIADVDGDGTVGIVDFLIVIGTWGPCE